MSPYLGKCLLRAAFLIGTELGGSERQLPLGADQEWARILASAPTCCEASPKTRRA